MATAQMAQKAPPDLVAPVQYRKPPEFLQRMARAVMPARLITEQLMTRLGLATAQMGVIAKESMRHGDQKMAKTVHPALFTSGTVFEAFWSNRLVALLGRRVLQGYCSKVVPLIDNPPPLQGLDARLQLGYVVAHVLCRAAALVRRGVRLVAI